MSYKVLVTELFEKDLKRLSKKYKSIKNDISTLIQNLKNQPMQGTPLGKNCYKIRLAIASMGKGKSGGARVITCVKIISNSGYLVKMYDKTEKENLSDNELKEILFLTNLL